MTQRIITAGRRLGHLNFKSLELQSFLSPLRSASWSAPPSRRSDRSGRSDSAALAQLQLAFVDAGAFPGPHSWGQPGRAPRMPMQFGASEFLQFGQLLFRLGSATTFRAFKELRRHPMLTMSIRGSSYSRSFAAHQRPVPAGPSSDGRGRRGPDRCACNSRGLPVFPCFQK